MKIWLWPPEPIWLSLLALLFRTGRCPIELYPASLFSPASLPSIQILQNLPGNTVISILRARFLIQGCSVLEWDAWLLLPDRTWEQRADHVYSWESPRLERVTFPWMCM